jgi:hypothetical protein
MKLKLEIADFYQTMLIVQKVGTQYKMYALSITVFLPKTTFCGHCSYLIKYY